MTFSAFLPLLTILEFGMVGRFTSLLRSSSKAVFSTLTDFAIYSPIKTIRQFFRD